MSEISNVTPCSSGVLPSRDLQELHLHSLPSGFRIRGAHVFVEAGSLGVRGLISEVHAFTPEAQVEGLRSALRQLRLEETRRVHIFVHPEDGLYEAAYQVGFRPCPGETLFQRALNERPIIRLEPPRGYELREGSWEDIVRIQQQLSHVAEVAFQGWEVLLIHSQLGEANRFFKVIERAGAIVGVSIGGSHNWRGTITHTWVAEGHRNHGLGQILSDASLQALYDGGACAVHLMTTANNVPAERFWERQGFVRDTVHTFLEIDI